jgi:hypothetical protein
VPEWCVLFDRATRPAADRNLPVEEFIAHIQRLETAESSGHLSVPSVKSAAILWRNEIKEFKHWFGADDDETIARLMKELADKGMQKFVADLAVELQVNHL